MWKAVKIKLAWKGNRRLILQLRYLEHPHVSGQDGRGPAKDPWLSDAPARDQMCYCGAPGVAITKYIWVPLPKALSRHLFFPVDDPLFTGNPLLKVLSLSIDLRGTETLIAVFYLSPACIAFGNWPDTEQNPGISFFPNDPVSILYWPNRNFKDDGEKTPPKNHLAY